VNMLAERLGIIIAMALSCVAAVMILEIFLD
jgi:hypothetical protein